MTRNIWHRTAFKSIKGEVEVAQDDWTLVNPAGEALARLYKVSGGPQDGRWYWTVLFRPDGVIGKRLLLDLAPLKAHKRMVKIFTIDDTPCDSFSSILINDVTDCRTETDPVENCLDHLTLKSLSPVQLTK